MESQPSVPAYEGIYEVLGRGFVTPQVVLRPGDLARESAIESHLTELERSGSIRLIGFVRKDGSL